MNALSICIEIYECYYRCMARRSRLIRGHLLSIPMEHALQVGFQGQCEPRSILPILPLQCRSDCQLAELQVVLAMAQALLNSTKGPQ